MTSSQDGAGGRPESRPAKTSWRGTKEQGPAAVKHRWQSAAGSSSDSSARGGSWRRIKLVLGLLVLGGFFAALMMLFVSVPPVTPVIVITAANYQHPLPPMLWVQEDMERLTKLHKNTIDLQLVSFDNTVADGWQQLQRALQTASEHRSQRLIVYVVMHGVVDGQGNPCLLQASASPTNSAGWVTLSQLMDALDADLGTAGSQKLLVLDCVRNLNPWEMGIAYNTFAQRAVELAKRRANSKLSVLLSSGVGEVAAASPTLPGSAFGKFFAMGLGGAADDPALGGDHDQLVSLAELQRYLRGQVNRWSLQNRGLRQLPELIAPTTEMTLVSSLNASTQWELSRSNVRTRPAFTYAQIEKLWRRLAELEGAGGFRQYQPRLLGRLKSDLLRLEQLATAGRGEFARARRLYEQLDVQLDRIATNLRGLEPWPRSLYHQRAAWAMQPLTRPEITLHETTTAELLGLLTTTQAERIRSSFATLGNASAGVPDATHVGPESAPSTATATKATAAQAPAGVASGPAHTLTAPGLTGVSPQAPEWADGYWPWLVSQSRAGGAALALSGPQDWDAWTQLNEQAEQLAVPWSASSVRLGDIRAHAWIRLWLDHADTARRLAQDLWLFNNASDPVALKAACQEAQLIYGQAQTVQDTISSAYAISDEMAELLPWLARWFADPLRPEPSQPAADAPSSQEVYTTALVPATEALSELMTLLDSPPTAPLSLAAAQQEHVARVERLLLSLGAATGPDQPPVSTGLWMKARAAFDAECAALLTAPASPETVRRLQAVLATPAIAPALRTQLWQLCEKRIEEVASVAQAETLPTLTDLKSTSLTNFAATLQRKLASLRATAAPAPTEEKSADPTPTDSRDPANTTSRQTDYLAWWYAEPLDPWQSVRWPQRRRQLQESSEFSAGGDHYARLEQDGEHLREYLAGMAGESAASVSDQVSSNRSELNLAEASVRAAASLGLPGTVDNWLDQRCRRDVQEFLLWRADRVARDFWGPRHDGEDPMFARAAEAYLLAAHSWLPVANLAEHQQKLQRYRQAAKNLFQLRTLSHAWTSTERTGLRAAIRIEERERAVVQELQLRGLANVRLVQEGLPLATELQAMTTSTPGQTLPSITDGVTRPVTLHDPRGPQSENTSAEAGPSTTAFQDRTAPLQVPATDSVHQLELLAHAANTIQGDLQVVGNFRGHRYLSPVNLRGDRRAETEVSWNDDVTTRLQVDGDASTLSVLFVLDASQSTGDAEGEGANASGAAGPPPEVQAEVAESEFDRAKQALLLMLNQLSQQPGARAGVLVYGSRVGWSAGGGQERIYRGPKLEWLYPNRDVLTLARLRRFGLDEFTTAKGALEPVMSWGNSPHYQALDEAIRQLSTERSGRQKRIVMVTDGNRLAPRKAVAKENDLPWSTLVERTRAAQAQVHFLLMGQRDADDQRAVEELLTVSGGTQQPLDSAATLVQQVIAEVAPPLVVAAPKTDEPASVLGDPAGRGGSGPRGAQVLTAPLGQPLSWPIPDAAELGQAAQWRIQVGDVQQDVTLLGGENVQLQYRDGVGRLIVPEYRRQFAQVVPLLSDQGGATSTQLLVAHRPVTQGRNVTFGISLQDVQGDFCARPSQIWIEITPLRSDGSTSDTPLIFWDADYDAAAPVPWLNCVARDWPADATQALIRAMIRAERAEPQRRMALSPTNSLQESSSEPAGGSATDNSSVGSSSVAGGSGQDREAAELSGVGGGRQSAEVSESSATRTSWRWLPLSPGSRRAVLEVVDEYVQLGQEAPTQRIDLQRTPSYATATVSTVGAVESGSAESSSMGHARAANRFSRLVRAHRVFDYDALVVTHQFEFDTADLVQISREWELVVTTREAFAAGCWESDPARPLRVVVPRAAELMGERSLTPLAR